MNSEQKKIKKPKTISEIKNCSLLTVHCSLIGFWGYPDPKIVSRLRKDYPNAEWVDLDVDFGYPDVNILPDAYCKIIKNIINNAMFLKGNIVKIVGAIGKDKCDSGWFAAKILKDMGFDVIDSIYQKFEPKNEIKICTSNLPLIDKVNLIMNGVIRCEDAKRRRCVEDDLFTRPLRLYTSTPLFGFWGVPPNDLEILKLFPDETHVFGWTRCVEACTPADVELEMYVDENLPTVFYSQAFCAKSQLAKYLADKYDGLYIDIDDYATNSIRAKIEAFLRLR
ncbi:MAG: hypothetical protein PHC64_04245 [Candidatus Gastranaerophilales bacterium]|nr:hypothetical protein [Candidatus Gastranaerophilales bacterium]